MCVWVSNGRRATCISILFSFFFEGGFCNHSIPEKNAVNREHVEIRTRTISVALHTGVHSGDTMSSDAVSPPETEEAGYFP